MLAIYFRRYQK